MDSNIDIWQFVHRANIAKYKRILTTYLTEHERRFVEARLAEEQAAFCQLASIEKHSAVLNNVA